MKATHINELVGKTLKMVQTDGREEILFHTEEGETYKLWHNQQCCESVEIEDINGHLDDLTGSPILQAEEVTSKENPSDANMEWQDVSFTWTFYKLATRKGYVTIRWYGTSNGCYSETVTFCKVKGKKGFTMKCPECGIDGTDYVEGLHVSAKHFENWRLPAISSEMRFAPDTGIYFYHECLNCFHSWVEVKSKPANTEE